MHKLLGTGGVPTSLTLVLAVADGLFGLCGSERTDELFIGTLPPTPTPYPFPVTNKPYGLRGRKAL